MSVVSSRLIRWILRFLVVAAIYAAGSIVWISMATGWENLGRFAASIAFAVTLLPSWLIAVVIEHLFISKAGKSLIVLHPLMVVGLFVAISVFVFTGFFDDPANSVWLEMPPFVLAILIGTLLDATADVFLAGKLMPMPSAAL